MQLTQFDGGSIVGALNGQLKRAKIRLISSSAWQKQAARRAEECSLADCVPFGARKKPNLRRALISNYRRCAGSHECQLASLGWRRFGDARASFATYRIRTRAHRKRKAKQLTEKATRKAAKKAFHCCAPLLRSESCKKNHCSLE